MKLKDKIVVITGGADGIGKGLAERFHAEGAKAIVVVDLLKEKAEAVAQKIGGKAYGIDVTNEAELVRVIDETEANIGPIDLFVSNAGIGGREEFDNAASATNAVWQKVWEVNLMAHVYAARALIPRYKARGGGYFLQTASAAGLLSQIGSAVYSVTKHAAVAFGESLAITHRDDNIRVSVLCPQAVDTPLLRQAGEGSQNVDGVLTPEQVADVVVDCLDRETFLILPHEQVRTYIQRKTGDYDRWLFGMSKLRRKVSELPGGGSFKT
ncbi:SDR family oxidoreductase [Zavarzinia sp. CC-PAN008]|uniref:SDR family oxidoreductase n=1 Tax=Zavarzinia sp. CC-PAN008 TaxID=3243332 RepID=UPI003F749457